MRTRFTLGGVAMTTALAVMPAGTAAAQSAQAAQSPQTAQPRLMAGSPAAPHLVGGVVRDMTGHALAGVCVFASGADGVLRMAHTSASGRYPMSLPRAGAYEMQYRSCQPGKAAALTPPVTRRIEVGAAPVTALPVTTLRPRRQTGKDRLTVVRAGSWHVAHEPGASGSPTAGGMTGRVTGPAGRPIAGICVVLTGDSLAAGTETANNGTYDFGAGVLPAGSYRVVFTSSCPSTEEDPFTPIAPGPWAPEWYKDEFARAKSNPVQLRAHKVTRGIDAVMRRTARISGVVTTPGGRRIKNACVFVLVNPSLVVAQATTNSSGAYTVTGLDAGSYRVLVDPGCVSASPYGQAWYPRASTFAAARKVAARFGHLTSGINVVVPKGGVISGVIRVGGKTGKPLGGICIGVGIADEIIALGDAVSRPNGTYRVEGLSPGNYQVLAQVGCGNNGNYAPASYPHPVRVVNGSVASGIDLYLQPGGTLSGTVTDAATRKPIQGICVFDSLGDGGVTGPAGTYTIDQLPAQRTTVGFEGGCGNGGSYAPQFYDNQVTQEAAQRLTITAGHVTSGIDAAMLPGATITGRVTNSAGRPVSGICVAVVPENQAALVGDAFVGGDTSTTKSGSYGAANLAPGNYAVAFFAGCFGPSNVAALQWFKGQPSEEMAGMVDAPAGRTAAGIDAVVSRGGSIAGTVDNTSGQPVEVDCVTAINRRTGRPSAFDLGDDGSFAVSSLAPGTYTVIASDCTAGDNLAASVYPRPVTVRTGLTTSKIGLRLPPGGVVAGRITTTAGGRPVPGACVRAIPVNPASASIGIDIGNGAGTGRLGRYTIIGLRTGSYRVTVDPNCAGNAVNLQTVTLQHPVRVTGGKVTAGVNAALPAGGSIAGQVTGPAAAPVPGACVAAHPITDGPVVTALSGADGTYVVTGLTPGRYKVEFGDPSCSDGAAGLGTQWYKGAAGSGSAAVITVTAGRTASAIDGALPADGTITGSVTGSSASKLTGVCVSAVPLATGERVSLTVSAGGSYTLTDLQPGRYKVEFQSGCGQDGVTTQWWRDAASSAAAKVITITAGATVSGIDATMTG